MTAGLIQGSVLLPVLVAEVEDKPVPEQVHEELPHAEAVKRSKKYLKKKLTNRFALPWRDLREEKAAVKKSEETHEKIKSNAMSY